MKYTMNVNDAEFTVDVDEDTPLLWVLRDSLALNGTKFGCGIAACGACTVHIDGVATRSCVLPISALGERKITTIEYLSADGAHPIQQAWKELDVPQCGYCQSGMIMAAAALLAQNNKPSREKIDMTMSNICRCGTYNRVRSGILRAVEIMASQGSQTSDDDG